MNELVLEIFGWLGYLERPAVLLQLLVAAAVIVLTHQARRRRWLGSLPALAYTPVGLALLGLLTLGLELLQRPSGLSAMLWGFWLGWYGLGLLRLLLLRWLPVERVRQLDTRLLRPGYLLFCLLLLISEIDNLKDLAVIEMGQLLGVQVLAGKVFNALLVIYLVLVGCAPPAAALAWGLQKALDMSDGTRKATELMLRYLVVGLGLLGVAVHLGFNANAVIAVAGGLSVGLGFGIKEVFSNFVSGLWLLFEGAVRPGEVLMLDGEPCEVRRLGLRATMLWRERDNAELLIPNQTFFTEAATSYTASDRMRRSQVTVGAAYHHPPEVVISLLQQTALSVPAVLKTPKPEAFLIAYGDFAIQYELHFWIADPLENPRISSAVNQAIWEAFEQHNIEIPFPQAVEYSMVWPPQDHRPNVG